MRPAIDTFENSAQSGPTSLVPAGDQADLQVAFAVAYLTIFCLIFLLLFGRRKFYDVDKAKRRLGTEHVLPVKNIRDKWLTVALDGVLALMCGIPGFGLFALALLFYRYSYSCLHLLMDTPDVDPEERTKPHWLLRLLVESLLWTNLALRCCRDVKVYHGHLSDLALANNIHAAAREKFRIVSFDLFASTCITASTLLWRSLLINSIEIKAHVRHHRQIAWATVEDRGRSIWGILHEGGLADFQKDYEKDIFKEDSLQQERLLLRRDWNWNRYHVLLVSVSSLVMCGGMLRLHSERIQVDWSQLESQLLRTFTPWTTLWLITVSTFHATIFWIKFTWGVLRMTSEFQGRSNRLLILSAISKPYLSENWGETNLNALASMVNGCSIGIEVPETMVRSVHVTDPSLVLDLSTPQLKAWWQLRRFLQIDALDGACGVEFCSVVVVFLLCNYAMVGLTIWFAEQKVRTFGFLMILLLSGVLIGIMCLILQTCVDTNTLLDRDAEILCAASQQVWESKDEADETDETSKKTSGTNPRDRAMLLHSLEREASATSGKQQLFGITVTANLRNGWILSLFLAFLSSAWKVVGNMVANHMDVLEKITQEAKRRGVV